MAAQEATAALLAGADCRISVVGDPQGGISRASMDCTGGPVRIGVHPQLLGALKQSFHGVVWDAGCSLPACLIRFCGNTSVSISNSTITGLSTVKAPELLTVVCLAERTCMLLHNTTISNNNATAVAAVGKAQVHVCSSTLAGNTGYGQSGGVTSLNSSVVVVSGGSSITSNMAF